MDVLDAQEVRRVSPVEYATFGQRLLAALVDTAVLILPIGGSIYFGYTNHSLLVLLVGTIVSALYKPLMEGIYGATLGKMAVGILMVDQNNDSIDLGQSFLKNGIYLISSAVGILSNFWLFDQEAFTESEGMMEAMMAGQGNPYQMLSSVVSLGILISCLAMLGSDKKQTLHDRIGKVFCVTKDSIERLA